MAVTNTAGYMSTAWDHGDASGTTSVSGSYGDCQFHYTVSTDYDRTTHTTNTTFTTDVKWDDGSLYAWTNDSNDAYTWHMVETPEITHEVVDSSEAEIHVTRVTYDRHDLRIYLDDQHRVHWKVWVEAGEYNDETQADIEQQLNQEGDRFRRWFYVDRHHEIPVEERARRREAEQRLAEERRRRQEEHDRREAERKAKTDKAEQVAQQLLEHIIGEEQLQIYNQTGRLMVKGEKADYIIQKGGLVKMVEKDKIIDLCIHLRDKMDMPPTDNVIALKLMAEAEEEEFLKTANRHESEPRPEELPLAACM